MGLPHQASPFGGPYRGTPRRLSEYSGQPVRPFGLSEMVQNADGSRSTEITVTARTPEGEWVNIPSLYMQARTPSTRGGPVRFTSEDAAWQAARQYEQATGQQFPRFATLEEAERAAQERSAGGGTALGTLSAMAGRMKRS